MSEPITYDLTLLEQSLAKWHRSPALRTVYADLFAAMRRVMVPGRTLEIGSGIGVARDFLPNLVTSDIVATKFVDRAVSAYAIPPEGWSNLVAFDVLHHLQEPLRFFASAAAALAPGGRIVLIEPAGTPGARCNRQLNAAIHRIAITQARCLPRARAYLERRAAMGNTRNEARRALKRHLSDHVYRALLADAEPASPTQLARAA